MSSTRTMRLSRTDRGSAIQSQGVMLIYNVHQFKDAIRLQDLEPWTTADPGKLEADGCDLDNWADVRWSACWPECFMQGDNDAWKIPCGLGAAEAPMSGSIHWGSDDTTACSLEDNPPPRFSCLKAEGWGEVDRLWGLLNVFFNQFLGALRNPFEGFLGVCGCSSVMSVTVILEY